MWAALSSMLGSRALWIAAMCVLSGAWWADHALLTRRLEGAETRLAEAAVRIQALNEKVEAFVQALDAAREQAEGQRMLAAESASRARQRASVVRGLKTAGTKEKKDGDLDDASSDAVLRHIFGSFERVRGKE